MEQELASVSAQRHVSTDQLVQPRANGEGEPVLVSGTSSEEEQNGLEQAETIPFYPVPYEDRPSIFVADHWLRLEQNIFRPNTTRRPAPPVVPARPSTFVGISSYRDGARCGNTLFEVFSKAADPARVTVGVVDQRAAGEPSCLDVYCSMWRTRRRVNAPASSPASHGRSSRSGGGGEDEGEGEGEGEGAACPHRSQVRVQSADWLLSSGPIRARHQQQALVREEDFCLQVCRSRTYWTEGSVQALRTSRCAPCLAP
jgi:hypothetical protein